MSNPVISHLNLVLANSYALILKLHNYHWNVTGQNFKAVHEMFEAQYNELFAAVDVIAERIRQKNSLVTASFTSFKKLQVIQDGVETIDSKEMLLQIASDHDKLAELAADARLNSADDEVTIDLMVTRQATHEKFAWLCRSSG